MKYFLNTILFVFVLSLSPYLSAWGLLGHRVVGEVASHHLTPKAQKQITKILGHHTLAEVSNFMDDIKSDNIERYDTLNAYHYVSIPDGLTYGESNIIHQRSEEHTSELQSRGHLVCRLLLEK